MLMNSCWTLPENDIKDNNDVVLLTMTLVIGVRLLNSKLNYRKTIAQVNYET